MSIRMLLVWLLAPLALAVTKVACVGDSITFGSGVEDREHLAYPAQLSDRLGAEYEVRNFGLSGRTMLAHGDHPYVKEKMWKDVLAWQPDVAVIMLGTNDTKPQNWQHAADFAGDTGAMIGELRNANRTMRILLALPVPVPGAGNYGINEQVMTSGVIPALLAVAHSEGTETVDLHLALEGHDDWFPDRVHPNAFGAEAMADRVGEAVLAKTDAGYDIREKLKAAGISFSTRNFHGYEQLSFHTPDGLSAIVVRPGTAATGHPWFWRTYFFGHEPRIDRELLDRGFHVAWVSVDELYGNAEADMRMGAFYRFATGLGLSPKPTLAGISRGGLPMFNWASENPDKVSALYGDNPVCDIRSWPGGKGKGPGSPGDWRNCMKTWGLDDMSAMKFDRNPIDRIKPLAAAKVPVLLVLGMADEVVPFEENGGLLAKKYEGLGGPLQVWPKPGQHHHPHGLHPPAPLRRAILRANGIASNPAAWPVRSAEFRASKQGWPGAWSRAFEDVKKAAAAHSDAKVVFLGDSVTQALTGHADRMAKPSGPRAIDRHFGDLGALSLGLSGDRTEHILYRLRHGQMVGLKPSLVVLTTGVNDMLSGGYTGLESAIGTKAVVDELRLRCPTSKILLLGCFPGWKEADAPARAEAEILHARCRQMADGKTVQYLDLRRLFLNPDGTPNGRMVADAIHLTGDGMEAWMAALRPVADKMLQGR